MTASRYSVREIRCDYGWDKPDSPTACFETVEEVGPIRFRDLRRGARKGGWRCDCSGDWCPAHRDADRSGS